MIKCKNCNETCHYSYYFVDGDYYCEFCHSSKFTEDEWNELHNHDPYNHYWSSINEEDYNSMSEQDKADFINDDIRDNDID